MKWLNNVSVRAKLLIISVPLAVALIISVVFMASELNSTVTQMTGVYYDVLYQVNSNLLNAERDYYQAMQAAMEYYDFANGFTEAPPEFAASLMPENWDDYINNWQQVYDRVQAAEDIACQNVDLYNETKTESGMSYYDVMVQWRGQMNDWEAAYDLQAAIDGAAAGTTVTLPEDVTASVVIDKDLTLDLGGHELVGAEGEIAITVENADVTVRNGHVYSKFENVRSAELAATVVDESPAAIRVIGGSLTAEGLRVVGSFARIPTTTKYHLPTGSAIEAVNGAEVTVIQSSLVGRYGVNNQVTGLPAGGKVTIEDGILMAFMRGVKDMSKLVLGDGTEDVNAADRLEGFLNSGIKLEARERNLMKTVFADRLHIYTKSVDDAPEVEQVSCDGTAVATAKVDDSRVWENNTSTDASYKFVPDRGRRRIHGRADCGAGCVRSADQISP